MQFGNKARRQTRHPFQPARLAAVAVLLASSVLVTFAGVAVGDLVRDRLKVVPTPAEARVLDQIDLRRVVVADPVSEAKRGPNRADLGGGRSELGASR